MVDTLITEKDGFIGQRFGSMTSGQKIVASLSTGRTKRGDMNTMVLDSTCLEAGHHSVLAHHLLMLKPHGYGLVQVERIGRKVICVHLLTIEFIMRILSSGGRL